MTGSRMRWNLLLVYTLLLRTSIASRKAGIQSVSSTQRRLVRRGCSLNNAKAPMDGLQVIGLDPKEAMERVGLRRRAFGRTDHGRGE